MKTGKYLCLLALLLVLLSPVPSIADITFYVSPDGDRSFNIEGDDISDTATIEITVKYDPAVFANPRVSVEGGTVTDIFDTIPGMLVFTANQGDEPGPSFLAHLTFDKIGNSQGGPFSVTGKIMEQDGMITPSRAMTDPSAPSLLTADPDNEEKGAKAEKPAAAKEAAVPGTGTDPVMKSEKSVLQRFREFKGERSLKAFTGLFERNPQVVLIQEPAVIISDGKTPVSVRFEVPQQEGEPTVAASDAILIQILKDGENGWIIRALPNEGTWKAGLNIKMGAKELEFPLVVAPPVTIREGIAENNFIAELDRFVADRSARDKKDNEPLPPFLYEYIFTANCLANSGNPAVAATGETNHTSNANR